MRPVRILLDQVDRVEWEGERLIVAYRKSELSLGPAAVDAVREQILARQAEPNPEPEPRRVCGARMPTQCSYGVGTFCAEEVDHADDHISRLGVRWPRGGSDR